MCPAPGRLKVSCEVRERNWKRPTGAHRWVCARLSGGNGDGAGIEGWLLRTPGGFCGFLVQRLLQVLTALSAFPGMMSPKIEAVVRKKYRMAECPVWEEETGQLMYVDINAQSVCRWDPLSNAVQTVGLRDRVGCMALHRSGSYVVAVGTSLGLLDWPTGQVQWLAQVDRDKPNNRFNDGKVDPAGRFVAGTMPEPSSPGVWSHGQGSVYTLYADGSVMRHLDGLGISNGLDWSMDHRTFYHVDSLGYTVQAYDYDLMTGNIGPHQPCSRLRRLLEQSRGRPSLRARTWVSGRQSGRTWSLGSAGPAELRGDCTGYPAGCQRTAGQGGRMFQMGVNAARDVGVAAGCILACGDRDRTRPGTGQGMCTACRARAVTGGSPQSYVLNVLRSRLGGRARETGTGTPHGHRELPGITGVSLRRGFGK
ncbi:PREDICTED: regucalcin-like [Chrysochloris asiatica]|uniref:Regucalcin-like n=1 Tax=Chrysochloris asiatica TaxID=185453 RepID=A0A9B0UA72_CHRAS|nr:PREDICTED: regucalcin-like [Chrysochloris asiatica]